VIYPGGGIILLTWKRGKLAKADHRKVDKAKADHCFKNGGPVRSFVFEA